MTFIDSRSKVFRHLERVVLWNEAARGLGDKPAPVTVEWDLSNRCSLGCQDCHFAHTHSRGPWVAKGRTLPMAFQTTGDLAHMGLVHRVCGELARAGVRGVIWSGGGEPTLHPEWQEAVILAANAGLEQGMYTLGGHFTKESATLLAQQAAFVVVSLDAADAQTYAKEKGAHQSRFSAACEGIRWLSEAKGAAVGVSFLLHAKNWTRIGDMLALSRFLGATYATFRPAIQFSADAPMEPTQSRDWVTKALPALALLSGVPDVEVDVKRFIEYRDWQSHGYSACHGIRLNTTITPDGRMWVCPNRRGVSDSSLGDLNKESFHAIWAKHPGSFQVDQGCRVMCRLHPINQTLAAIEAPRAHEAFL